MTYTREQITALANDLDKAKGSEILPKVYLGMRNAEEQCVKAAAMIRQMLGEIEHAVDVIDAVDRGDSALDDLVRRLRSYRERL